MEILPNEVRYFPFMVIICAPICFDISREHKTNTQQGPLHNSPYTRSRAYHCISTMLTIEKRRTEKVDWIKPLQKYISTQYSEQSSNEHTEALSSLQSLREDCRNAADKSDAVKDLWLRYELFYASCHSTLIPFLVHHSHIISTMLS